MRTFPKGGAGSSGTISLDSYKPGATLNTTPILFGGTPIIGAGDQGMGAQYVYVPRDGQVGAIYEFSDIGGAGDRLGNGVWNYSGGFFGGPVNYHRHENAAVTLTGASKTNVTANYLQYVFGGNVAHDSGTRGSYWEYTQTCNRLVLCKGVLGNGGLGLVAVDGNPYPNGTGLLTVTAAQTAGGAHFDNVIIPSLPAPWNTLSTLEGCKYFTCFGALDRNNRWLELWSGAEGSHTVRVAATNTGSGGATNRLYIAAFGYQSTADTAVTTTYLPPSPGVNTSGRTIAPWLEVYLGTSMQEFLEQYQPSGTTAQFNGGNHADGFSSPTASGESCCTGFRFTGQTTSGSIAVSAVTDTGDLQNSDNLIVFSIPMQLVTAANPTGKTSSAFNLSANASVSMSAPCAFWRADWTITTGASSATQAFTGTNLPAEGDILYFINSAGSASCGEVRSVSGSNVTLTRSVTTTTGMFVALLSKASARSSFFADGFPIFARPYEMIVPTNNGITCEMVSTRTHPQIITTLSAGAARGANTVSVTSATGLAIGQTVQIHAPRSRYVGQITGISGTTITVSPPLTSGFASGARFGRGTTVRVQRTFKCGDAYSFYYQANSSGYFPLDSAAVLYTTMQTTMQNFTTGKTFDQFGAVTPRTWVDVNDDSPEVSIQACVMNSPQGVAHASRIFDGVGIGRYQTRTGLPGLSKIYITARDATGVETVRNPGTQLNMSFGVDIRPGNH